MRFRATGGSMTPFIRNNDILTIAPLTQRKIRLGDVVAFKNSKKENGFRLSIHRVVQILDNQKYLVKGDNISKHPDGVVSKNQILGKIIKIERDNQIVRFGLGPERHIIAILSKQNFLIAVINWIRRAHRIFCQRNRP
jgi:signal peptidase I